MQSLDNPNGDLETGGGGGGNGCGAGGGVSSCSSNASVELCNGEIIGAPEKMRRSSVSECLVEVDLETGEQENDVHLEKPERDCRICHLSLDLENPESGLPIELGCSCKDDLSVAHKHCAEAWFKIRGNKTCEICGSVAQNVVGISEAEAAEQWSEGSTAAVTTETPAPTSAAEAHRNFWQGHRFLNFLLACMVFAFVISWLFHFNVPS